MGLFKNQNTVPGNGLEGLRIPGDQIASVSGYLLIMSLNELKNVDAPKFASGEIDPCCGWQVRAQETDRLWGRQPPTCATPRLAGRMEWVSIVSLIPLPALRQYSKVKLVFII